MRARMMRAGAGATLGAAGAVLWAYGLTVLQPAAEAAGYAENNSYWPRDVRWAAVLGMTGLLVALSRGARRGRVAAVAAGAVWIGADLALDRAGTTAWAPVAGVAALAVAAAAVAIGRPDRPREPHRRTVLTVVAMCAATAPVAAVVESPTDTEPALPWTRALAATLLVIAAVAGALATAPDRPRTRFGLGVLTAAAAVALLVPGRPAGAALAGGALLAATWLLSRPWPGPAQALGVTVAALVAYPLVSLVAVLVLVAVPLGTAFTALAGNEPIHSADTDLLHVAVGMGVGLVFAAAARASAALTPTPRLRDA